MNQEIAERIHAADLAIREERFDDLMQFYCEEMPCLSSAPGKTAIGKAAIREAFVKIAAYFQNSIVPTQGRMESWRPVIRCSSSHRHFWMRTTVRRWMSAWNGGRRMSFAA